MTTAENTIMIRNLLGSFVRTASFALAIALSGTAGATTFSNLYVFGDSLADSGNNALMFDAYFGGVRTATPLASPLVPAFPYATDRYSNGPVWTEYLANSLGLAALPSLAEGTNFAFGGARTGPVGSSFPYSLTDQVGMFLYTTNNSAPSDALYIVEGGGNDARDVLISALGGADQLTLAAMIQGYVSNTLTILSMLSAAGADQFLLWNIPDIGKIPAILAAGPNASASASYLVSVMNQALALSLGQLPSYVTDGIHYFDAFGAMNDIVASPGAFGFGNVTDACAMSVSCIADPGSYFFWDGIHPTTAGHATMARLALAEIPEPGAVLLLMIGLVALFALRRKPA